MHREDGPAVEWAGGERWYLNAGEHSEQASLNAELTSEDPWESILERWLSSPEGADFSTSFGYYASLAKILADCLQIPPERRLRAHQMRIAQILAALGWKRKQLCTGNRREWVYAAPEGFVRESISMW